MNFIDSAMLAMFPKKAYEREAWRQSYKEIRNYDAGNTNKTNSRWVATNQSAEMTDSYHRDTIRARARDLERNSDICNSIISAYRRNVVRNGFTLQSRTDNEDLNKQLEELWKEWTKKKNCDVTETQSFNQILRMAIERKKIDGGIFFLKIYTEDGILPFRLQLLEVDELDQTQMSPKKEGNKIRGGIEYNQYNKATGYYFKKYDIDGYNIEAPVYVEAKDVIFLYSKTRPSQIREMSDMTPTINRIRDVNEFMNAVSVKERITACLAVFIKKLTPTGNFSRNNSSTEPTGEYAGKSIRPGMIQELRPGEEVQAIIPNGQSTEATGFVKLQQQLAGSGQGLSYEATSRDMSQTNYSSARQGAIEDELTYAEEIEMLTDAMDEVFETFVEAAVLSGLVKGVSDFWTNRNLYIKHEWVASPKKWIDPLKEANANKIAMQTGQKTFKQICAENGRDYQDQLNEIVDIIEYGKTHNVDLLKIIYGVEGGEKINETEKTPE